MRDDGIKYLLHVFNFLTQASILRLGQQLTLKLHYIGHVLADL